jgi:hypothetical protein
VEAGVAGAGSPAAGAVAGVAADVDAGGAVTLGVIRSTARVLAREV